MNNTDSTINDTHQAAQALYKDAEAQATTEHAAWPYAWFANRVTKSVTLDSHYSVNPVFMRLPEIFAQTPMPSRVGTHNASFSLQMPTKPTKEAEGLQ